MQSEETHPLFETTLASLSRRGFETRKAGNRKDAREIILEMIPQSASVGCGGSTTLRQIEIFEALSLRGTILVNGKTRDLMEEVPPEARFAAVEKARRQAMTCDFFISGTNAVTLDGRLVNVDGVGNRVAGMFFGPKQVILVAGRNKIMQNLDVALDRVRHVTCPVHTSRITPDRKTPCASTGKCNDCWSKQRACCITTIIECKPLYTSVTVILVDEDLGLGWDPEWPEDRIRLIRTQYEAIVLPVTATSWQQKP